MPVTKLPFRRVLHVRPPPNFFALSRPRSTFKSLALSTPPLSLVAASRSFHSSPVTMVAAKIDGNAIAKSIRERLHEEIREKQSSNPRYRPALRIIQGASRLPRTTFLPANSFKQSATALTPVSNRRQPPLELQLTSPGTYVRMKLKAAEEVRPPPHHTTSSSHADCCIVWH